MDAKGWEAAFGKLARETMSSPELERYYSVPITLRARATFAPATVALCSPSEGLLGLCFRQLPGAGGKAENSRA